jgi:hypothetical protein
VSELGDFKPHGPELGFSTSVLVDAATPPGTAVVHDDQPQPGTFSFDVVQP